MRTNKIKLILKTMDIFKSQFLEEMGATNIKDIVFSQKKNKWVITYIDGEPDEFDFFDEMYHFLCMEGRDDY